MDVVTKEMKNMPIGTIFRNCLDKNLVLESIKLGDQNSVKAKVIRHDGKITHPNASLFKIGYEGYFSLRSSNKVIEIISRKPPTHLFDLEPYK